MRKLWEAAFAPPPRAADAGDQTRFAVLPQNTEDELTLSEVHSKLDHALNFLQRDVGYALLDDVRPATGGGVRLRQETKTVAAVQKGDRSARAPKDPVVKSGSDQTALQGQEDLDDSVIKLLHVIFQRSGGKLRVSELADAFRASGTPSTRLNGQLDRLFRDVHNDQNREIDWAQFEALYAEGKAAQASGSSAPADGRPAPTKVLADPALEEVLQMSPEVAKYAHYQCDLVLVSRFANVLYKSILQDLWKDADAGLITHVEAKDGCKKAILHAGLYKAVLQGVRLMHLCDYDYADVVLVLGYATVYFRSTFISIGKKMSPNEAAHVVVLLIYLAHAFLLDETCPLRIWQKHIFRKYCTLKVLDAALFRLFQMRPSFKLRISDEEERKALLGLSGLADLSDLSCTSEDDREEASGFIKQMMGANFEHPKLQNPPGKDVLTAGGQRPNGAVADAKVSGNGRKSANASNGSGGASSGAVAAPAAAVSGSSSAGSNGRSPPGSGQSADRHSPGEAGAARTEQRSSRPAQPPSVQAGRVSAEATSLWTSSQRHRETNQRRSDRSSKDSSYSSNRPDEGALPLVSHADRPLTAAATVAK